MKKMDLKKLENLMIKNYKRQISFQELQKNFFENDIERIKYIKSKLERQLGELGIPTERSIY